MSKKIFINAGFFLLSYLIYVCKLIVFEIIQGYIEKIFFCLAVFCGRGEKVMALEEKKLDFSIWKY